MRSSLFHRCYRQHLFIVHFQQFASLCLCTMPRSPIPASSDNATLLTFGLPFLHGCGQSSTSLSMRSLGHQVGISQAWLKLLDNNTNVLSGASMARFSRRILRLNVGLLPAVSVALQEAGWVLPTRRILGKLGYSKSTVFTGHRPSGAERHFAPSRTLMSAAKESLCTPSHWKISTTSYQLIYLSIGSTV